MIQIYVNYNINIFKLIIIIYLIKLLELILPILGLSSADCLEELYFNGTSTQKYCLPKPHFASNLLIEVYEKDSNKVGIENGIIKVKYDGEYYPIFGREDIEIPYSEFRSILLD